MPVLLPEDYTYPLPQLFRVQQLFDKTQLSDVQATLEAELHKAEICRLVKAGDRVAVAVGSRGIRNLQLVVKTLLRVLKAQGALPYIVSAMGSHGNGTEAGQREVLAGYGITEEALGVPVVTTVDVKTIGKTPSGKTVYFDRAALEADVIIPINRVKLHTDFVGPLQSGLCKMLVIGLGNQIGCSSIHEESPAVFARTIEEAATLILKTCPIAYGIALIENAYDETCHIEAVPATCMIPREKELVQLAKTRMPILIPPQIDVLVVEEIGKDISGAGYDPNILGKSSVLEQFTLPVPKIERMVLLGLTANSHGNGIGMGMFDVTVRSVFEQLDYDAMYANAVACRCIEDCRIPLVAADEEEAVRIAVKCIRGVQKDRLRIVKIKSTLALEYIEVSEAVWSDIAGDARVRLISNENEEGL